MTSLTQDELLTALEKSIPEISEEHDAAAEAWMPHDVVPWADGKNFAFLGGEDWTPEEQKLDDAQRAALMVLLLVKDNNPSLHRLLCMYCPIFSNWRAIVGVWTAEDNRHAIALRDYLIVTRTIDPQEVEDRRLPHVSQGYYQNPEQIKDLSVLDIFALMALHEQQIVLWIDKLTATVDDEILLGMLKRIRHDGAVQAQTFISLLNAGIVADPEAAVLAVDRMSTALQPLGWDVRDYAEGLDAVADYRTEDAVNAARKQVIDGLKLASVSGLTGDAEEARTRLLATA